MILTPLRDICVADSGAAVALSVSSRATWTAPDTARGEGLTPPTLRAGREKVGLSWWKANRRTT